MDSRKLAEAVEKPRIRSDVKILIIGIYTLSIAIIILIEVLRGNSKIVNGLLPFTTIPILMIPSLTPRRCYIYEKGIKIGRRFVEWSEVVEYEWKDGLLEMRFRGKPKRIVIVDRDGKIKEIVRKYVVG